MPSLKPPFPAYGGSEPYLFACYDHDDAALVYPELTRLHQQGINVWYDEGISPGVEWSEALAEHIEGCAVFLYFVTPRSVASPHCRRELSFALAERCTLLPVHLEETDLPRGLRLTLNNRQAIIKHQLSVETYQSKLKAAIRDAVDRVLVTVPSVSTQEQDTPRTVRDSRPAIAVLPFSNMSSDPEQEYFSDGIAEDILNRLAQIPQLIVKARTSSFYFKGQNRDVRIIGDLLGVTHLLEGSVRKIGNRVRISTQLVATYEDKHIWSAQYDRHLEDVFAVQDEISLAVLDALNLHLFGIQKHVPRTTNSKAYHRYLLGRYHNNHMDLASAVTAFEEALAIDANYPDACAALAEAHFSSTGAENVPVDAKLPLVGDLVGRALSLDAKHVVARQLRASIRFMIDRDYQAAIDECIDVARKHPGAPLDGYATILRAIGRSDLSLALADRVVELDPLSPLAHRNRGMYLRDLGRYDEAGESVDQARRLGLKVQNELATLALERQDAPALEAQLGELRAHLGAEHWLVIAHAAALHYLRGDDQPVKAQLADVERADRYGSNFFKWSLAICANDLQRSIKYYANALREHEHLAYTWSQGNVGMRRLFPWYYSSAERTEMLREFRLDSESVARLKVPALTHV